MFLRSRLNLAPLFPHQGQGRGSAITRCWVQPISSESNFKLWYVQDSTLTLSIHSHNKSRYGFLIRQDTFRTPRSQDLYVLSYPHTLTLLDSNVCLTFRFSKLLTNSFNPDVLSFRRQLENWRNFLYTSTLYQTKRREISVPSLPSPGVRATVTVASFFPNKLICQQISLMFILTPPHMLII